MWTRSRVFCSSSVLRHRHHSFDDRLSGRFFIVWNSPPDGLRRTAFAPASRNGVRLWHDFRTDRANYRPKWDAWFQGYHCLNDFSNRQRLGSIFDGCRGGSVQSPTSAFGRLHQFLLHFPLDPNDKPSQERQVWQVIEESGAELVILARYMQVLSPELCRKLDGKAINIHHSLLPGFKGAKPYHQAYNKGVKLVGATAHYINNDLDEGPIIAQGVEAVDHSQYPGGLIKGSGYRGLRWRGGGVSNRARVVLNANRTVVL